MLLIQEVIEYLISRIDEFLCTSLNIKQPKLIEIKLISLLLKVELQSNQLPNEVLFFHEDTKEKKDENNNEHVISDTYDWLTLPQLENFKVESSVLFWLTQKSSSNADIDKTPLKISKKTWGELMQANVEDFTGELNIGLIQQPFDLNKMLILCRFKKHLIFWSEYAKKSLQEREKKYVENNKIEFQDKVDEWLVIQVNARIQESNKLLNVALKNAITSIQVGPILPYDLEIFLDTCSFVLAECLNFCTTVNHRCKRGIFHPFSMVDVLPKYINENHALMIINKHSIRYFVRNVYDQATYQSYKKFNCYLPLNFVAYDPLVASAKRELLLSKLCEIEENTQNILDDPEKFWDSIYRWIHNAKTTFSSYTPFLAYYLKPPKCDQLWKHLHSSLYDYIPTSADNVRKEHQGCKI